MPPTEQPLPPHDNTFTIRVTLVIAVLLFSGGVTYWFLVLHNSVPTISSEASSNEAQNNVNVSALPTGYTRHEDSLLGVSFVVPSDWKVTRDYEKSSRRNDLIIESPDVEYKKSDTWWGYDVTQGARFMIYEPSAVDQGWWHPEQDMTLSVASTSGTPDSDGYELSTVHKVGDIYNLQNVDYLCAHCTATDAERVTEFAKYFKFINIEPTSTEARTPANRDLFTYMKVTSGNPVTISWGLQNEVLGEIFINYFSEFNLKFELVDQQGAVVGTLDDPDGLMLQAKLYATSIAWKSPYRLEKYEQDGKHYLTPDFGKKYTIRASLFPIRVDSFFCDATYTGTCKPIYADGALHAKVLEASQYSSESELINIQ
jgi:hypothetical protein